MQNPNDDVRNWIAALTICVALPLTIWLWGTLLSCCTATILVILFLALRMEKNGQSFLLLSVVLLIAHYAVISLFGGLVEFRQVTR